MQCQTIRFNLQFSGDPARILKPYQARQAITDRTHSEDTAKTDKAPLKKRKRGKGEEKKQPRKERRQPTRAGKGRGQVVRQNT